MLPYQPYYQNQEMLLQRQIENLNGQLQQLQSVKSKGMTVQMVDNFDNISANLVPMDNGALFVKNDGTEIQYRKWGNTGQILTTSYLPQIENNPNNTTLNEEKSKIGVSDEVIEDIKEQIDILNNRLDALEQVKKPRTRKKEAENEPNE